MIRRRPVYVTEERDRLVVVVRRQSRDSESGRRSGINPILATPEISWSRFRAGVADYSNLFEPFYDMRPQ